ncbi:MAG: beta-galactosidase trimerization domain-containing protein [Planctomycetes bacterium]|nr:beta-galactosidase trimerization domain-containing protein [Planctomycetota bacterium]
MRTGLLLLLLTIPPQAEPLKQPPPPKSWDRFTMLVWQYQTDVIRDKELYESLNLRGFHVDRQSQKLQAFAKESGWPYYVDHAADKGFLHLGKRAEGLGGKKEIIERPNSLADPKVMRDMKKILTQNVTAAKGSTAVAYAFDDEISTGNFCSPIETDGHPLAVAAYRKFLESMYGTIDKLNAQYGTTYAGFDAVEPKSYEAVREQLKPDALGRINLSPWCDWRSAMDTQWTDALAELTRTANAIDPDVPAGYVGGQMPCAFGGYDYRKVTKAVQWIEAYDIGGTNEILRSFWDQAHPRVQTFFSSKDPKRDAWFLWYYLCHGNRGVICWPDGWFKGGKPADYIAANAATFKEVQGPVSRAIIDGAFVHDPIAIYYSHPSIQATWALDAATHKGTWPRRSSSMESAMSTSNLTRIGWLKTLEDLGLQAKFVHQDHLLAGLQGYKVLLLNRALCLSDAEAKAIRGFAAAGGTVIADHLCGILDEHGKSRPAGALDDLFGVKRDLSKGILGGKTLTEADAERGPSFSAKSWAVDGADLFKGMPVFERGLGTLTRQGKGIYLNLSPAGYLLKRAKGEAPEWLALVRGLMTEAGIEPRVTLDLPRTEPIFWKNGDRMTLCLVRNVDRRASTDEFGETNEEMARGSLKLKLKFAKPVADLRNERTGKALGRGRDFEDDFVPWEANVYTYSP